MINAYALPTHTHTHHTITNANNASNAPYVFGGDAIHDMQEGYRHLALLVSHATSHGMYVCSGSLLANADVSRVFALTAKHCIADTMYAYPCGRQTPLHVDGNRNTSHTHDSSPMGPLRTKRNDHVFVYPHTNAQSRRRVDDIVSIDVALIELEWTVPDSCTSLQECSCFTNGRDDFARIAAQPPSPTEQIEVVGYGLDGKDHGTGDLGVLKKLSVNSSDWQRVDIRNEWTMSGVRYAPSSVFLIHNNITHHGPRSGDSGGPLINTQGDIVGVHSFGVYDTFHSGAMDITTDPCVRVWIDHVVSNTNVADFCRHVVKRWRWLSWLSQWWSDVAAVLTSRFMWVVTRPHDSAVWMGNLLFAAAM